MRVLHIINSLATGGAERLLLDTLPICQEKRHDVDLLLLTNQQTPFLSKLMESTFRGNLFVPDWANVYSPKNIGHIKRVLRDHRYDVIHVHLFPALYYVAIAKHLLGKQLRGTKFVFTEHNTRNRRLDSPIYRQVDKVVYRSYDKITAITPQVKHALVSLLGIDPHKIEVVYNGVNLNRFKTALVGNIRNELGISDQIILTQVSRFSEQKDQRTVIHALSLLPHNYALLLVGDGESRLQCSQLAEELGVASRAFFLGVRMDIPEILRASDIVIQSSHWEGFGLTAVEGMAVGKPVIASNVPGLSDVVKGYGFLFETGDVNELASAVLSLQDSNLYQEFSHKSVKRSLDFGVEKMVDKFLNLYSNI